MFADGVVVRSNPIRLMLHEFATGPRTATECEAWLAGQVADGHAGPGGGCGSTRADPRAGR
jgi:hypothetical protein